MRIFVRVAPKSSKSLLEKQPDGNFKAWLRAAPEKGKANDELVGLVAGHFGVKKSQVSIAAGGKSREKTMDII